LVVDPFAGSNLTGASAEILGRHWLAFDLEDEYLEGSVGRFEQAKGLEIAEG
jgi:DNA modification methylase